MGVIVLVASTIKIVEELIVFIGYKVSELKIIIVAVAIAKRVRKSVKIVGQQQ